MQLRVLMRLALVTVLAGVLLAPTVMAQQDALDATSRAQLAAIPLTSGELPAGYQLVGEAFLQADQSPFTGIDQETLSGAGFLGLYTSVYQLQGAPGTITSYVSLWTDAEVAQAGFALVEDESVTNPDAGFADEPLEAGDGPAELTTGTIDSDGVALNVSDATFVVDRFVVGVSVSTGPDNAIDAAGVTALVDTLESRAGTVADGGSVGTIDLGLPASVIDIRSLGTELQAGYLTSAESETLYGVSGSSLGGIQTSWVSLVATGDESTAPYIVVAVSSFENADNAARVVEQADDLVPLSVELQAVDGFSVEGVDAVRGFRYTSPTAPADAGPESFRGVAQVGSQVIVIDVQGAASVESAQSAVSDLLAAQVQCTAGTCELPAIELGS